MQLLYRPARDACVPLLVCFFAAASHGQTSFSISDAGADSDEERIEQALTRRDSIDFVAMRLQDAAETLSRQFQVPIVLASKKLDEAGVSFDVPVTKQLHSVPLESILRLILTDLELEFTVRNNVVLISTPEDIESHLLTRIYPVLDLVSLPRSESKDSTALYDADYDSLIELITGSIDPHCWDVVGGVGSLRALENAGSLIVSQTRDVHRKIDNLLAGLRRVKSFQGIPSLAKPKVSSERWSSRSGREAARRYSPTPVQAWQLPQVYSGERAE